MDMACDAALKNRRYDADGRLHILRSPISKATVNPYYGREIPDAEKLGLEPERIYYMLRDPGELAKAASSFSLVQLMFKHIAVSAEDPQQELIAGTVGSEVVFEAPYLIADLCIWDAEAIAGIETDTVRELSCSYQYKADMTPGMFEGERYDGVMRNIQGNHVALVSAGRAGSDVMAADSQLEKTMETKEGISKATEAANKVAGDEDDNAEKYVDVAEKGGDRKAKDKRAKDRKPAKDWEWEDWESDQKERELEKNDPEGQDRRKAQDAEEDEEDRAKRREFEKKAEDAEKIARDDFDGLVEKLEKKGYSKEYATKVAGKVAKEKGDDKAHDRKAKDRIARDAQTAEERAMWAQMRKDGSADDPEDDAMPASLRKVGDAKMKHAMDEFKRELREAEEARRNVRPVVGDVLAQDSAEDIYSFALDEMDVDRKGVHGVTALRALFNLAQKVSKPAPQVAYDAAAVEEKFPGATRRINVM